MGSGGLVPQTASRVEPAETVPAFLERKGQQFAKLAPRFELRCWLYSLGWLIAVRRNTARLAVPTTGAGSGAALDLCCGTGGVTRELARLFPEVIGVDLSPEMLAIARRRAPAATLIQGEAGQAPLPRAGFDACVIGLGLHEMPAHLRLPLLDRGASLLRRGGRLVVSDYCWPRSRVVRALMTVLGPRLIEPDVLEFMDWPLDRLLAERGLDQVAERRYYGGIFRIAAWEHRP
jgi:ubiquinone/menaquinone biosynthesis C-methylase UbiE